MGTGRRVVEESRGRPGNGDRHSDSTVRRLALGPFAPLALLITLQILFLATTLAADLVPNERIAGHLATAFQDGTLKQADYYMSTYGNQVDQFTECLGLTTGLADTGDAGFFRSSIADGYLGTDCSTAATAVSRYETSPVPSRAGTALFRYWHGYTLFTRPLLGVLPVDWVRLLISVVLIAAIAVFVIAGIRATGPWPIAGLMIPLVLTTDLADTPLSMQHAIALAAAFGGGGLMFWAARRSSGSARACMLAAIVAGSCYAFFDLLTNPPLCWSLVITASALATYGAAHAPMRRQRILKAMGLSGAGWIAGYVVTWSSKWLIAAAFLGPSRVLDNVRSEASFRLRGATPGLDSRLGTAINQNLYEWLGGRPFRLVIVIALIAIVVALLILIVGRAGPVRLIDVSLLALPAVLPVVWDEVLRNHSIFHAWFVYRSLAMSAGIGVAAALVVFLKEVRGEGIREALRT